MVSYLSKSKYLLALQCTKRLWLELNAPYKAPPLSESQRRIFENGTQVGIEARTRFPEGILITTNKYGLEQGVQETQQALNDGRSIIFEAVFLYDFIYAIADIITKNDDGSWTLIEVKSSTSVHDEHIHDLALQKYILEQAGLIISQVQLMHINSQYVHPNSSDLFTIVTVNEQVARVFPEVSNNLRKFQILAQNETEPDIPIGPQCKQPFPCPFKGYCWPEADEQVVFNIPKLSTPQKEDLRRQGIIFLNQIPSDYPLNGAGWDYINRILNQEVRIDRDAIKTQLATLQYPIYFFDFETDALPMPKFNGTTPYQQIPFQYSCHVLSAEGELEHFDYLHTGEDDPRLALAQSLVANIGETGSIVAYSAQFERDVLIKLAEFVDEYAIPLRSMADRLWDQLDIFRYYYKHYGFGASNSIKNVLPVLVPELSYKNLNVRKGDQAQSVWAAMIKSTDANSKNRMIEDLREYCKLDTLAMVKIHQVLTEQTNGKNLH
jgi:hypothetical protein